MPHSPIVTLADQTAARATTDASAPLIAGPDHLRLTYDEVSVRSSQVASALRATGVRRGDRVAVAVPKSPEVVMVYLGCLRSGSVFLPVNPAYTDDELRYLLDDADASLVVCEEDRLPAVGRRACLTLEELMARAAGQPEDFTEAVEPDDLAAILYTSGTTGRPKGAMLSHGNLVANAQTLADTWEFTDADVVLHALPVFHAHGLFVALNTTLMAGSSLRWLPRFDVEPVLRELASSTVFMGVPTYYTRLLADERLSPASTSTVRLFISGSAPLAAATHREFEVRTGHAILERYGMTETLMLASNPVRGDRRPGTVGRPLPGVSIRIDGSDATGGIEVRGPSVFSGYWRRPELIGTEFTPDGWFRTGDLGTIDADGYVHIVGRSKDLIITGGLNVYPKEIEDVLDECPGVAESAVIGLPDADFGEAVVAVVVAEPGTTLDTEQLRVAVRTQLAGYKVPKRVHVIDALPRNAMGKIEKPDLRARFAP